MPERSLDSRPGLDPRRLVTQMRSAVRRCELDLSGAAVLTEAASGAYAVTPVLAAMGGAAQVVAVTRPSRHGTVEEVREQTLRLAELAGVGRIEIMAEKLDYVVRTSDIVTNSGHLRPIDAKMVRSMKATAVVPLMYEAWEFRPTDVDAEACEQRGIPIAGTNERHPAVDVFSFLGIMAVKLILDAGVSVYGSRVLVLCDNPFASFIERGLIAAGASIDVVGDLDTAYTGSSYDSILLALKPGEKPVIARHEAERMADCWPGTLVAQFWGDMDRRALSGAGVPFWPPKSPPIGHMGILPSAIGPEPVIRLQAGGLKVGELLWRARRTGSGGDSVGAVVRAGWGQELQL